jgi:hypothetical protein
MIEIRDKWTLEPYYTSLSIIREEQLVIQKHNKEMQQKLNNK